MSKKRISLEVDESEESQIVNAIDKAEADSGNTVVEPTVEDVNESAPVVSQPEQKGVIAPDNLPVVNANNPTQTPEPMDSVKEPTADANGMVHAKPYAISDGNRLPADAHADAIAENQPAHTPGISKEVTFDQNGVPVPTTIAITAHAPSAADVENSPTAPLLTNTPITPKGPGTPPTPMINDAHSQVTTTTTGPSSEARPANPADPNVSADNKDAHTYYVYNADGIFQKFFTQEEFKGEAYKFAKEFVDQNPGFYIQE